MKGIFCPKPHSSCAHHSIDTRLAPVSIGVGDTQPKVLVCALEGVTYPSLTDKHSVPYYREDQLDTKTQWWKASLQMYEKGGVDCPRPIVGSRS